MITKMLIIMIIIMVIIRIIKMMIILIIDMMIIRIVNMMIIRTLDCCSEEGCGSSDQLMNIVMIIRENFKYYFADFVR